MEQGGSVSTAMPQDVKNGEALLVTSVVVTCAADSVRRSGRSMARLAADRGVPLLSRPVEYGPAAPGWKCTPVALAESGPSVVRVGLRGQDSVGVAITAYPIP
jgi:hypothetical protein